MNKKKEEKRLIQEKKPATVWKCRLFCCFILPLVLLFGVALPVAAAEEDAASMFGEENAVLRDEAVGEGLSAFRDAIPPEVAELLPDGFFSEDPEEMGEALQKGGALREILAVVGRLLGLSLRENLATLAGICGILLLAAVFRAWVDAPRPTAAVSRALSFTVVLALSVLLLRARAPELSQITAYFTVLQQLAAALLPLMGTLYAMGGNITAAVANHTVMSGFLSILEVAVSGTVMPVAGICLALALLDAVAEGISLSPVAALIKRSYTLGLSFLMILLCGVLGLQSTLAKGADSLALRTVRFAAGSFLPVVGGSVSEALRTVSGSVGFLRSVVGMGGVLVLLYAFLPVFLSVMTTRITLLLSGTVARLLGGGKEEKLLAELASVYGYFMAVIAALFVMTVFALTLLSHCATAI